MKFFKKIVDKLGIKKSYKLILNGKKLKIPIHNGMGYGNFQNSEPWMNEVLIKIGGTDKTLLDIGVNIGQTLIAWKTLFPTSNYIGFEPNTKCVNYVLDLINLNQFSSCQLEPVGISLKTEKTKLFILEKDPADSTASVIKDFRENENRSSITIQTKRLRNTNHTKFDIAKIDVEGAELEVIQSIFEVNQSATFICEILPVYSQENKFRLERQKEIKNILNSNNYAIFRVIKKGGVKIEEVQEFGIHSELEMCDYIFVPEDTKQALISKFS
jgi:FkbM family methyltransferase